MIISLDEALKLDATATQETCDGLETMVRKLTNNNFQLIKFRILDLKLAENTIKSRNGRMDVFRPGDTIEINGTDYNDGLYVVESVSDGVITVYGDFIAEINSGAIATKINYPADVLAGVKKLIAYDAKMRDKAGIKSETIARWSVTYYDVTAAESSEGYPVSLLGFLNKYKKLRWS
nr:MAG TPA: head to tail adaptor [Caudoviricetes sp.]